MYDRRSVLRMGGVVVAGSVAGCGRNAPERATVRMTADLKFEPRRARVRAGGTVVWENDETVDHSVTAYESQLPDGGSYFASGGFESEGAARSGYRTGAVEEGETYSHTFGTDGRFPYFCIPHESSMRGVVVVE